MGSCLPIPVCRGTFALGEWQGIYLNEHRDVGGRGEHGGYREHRRSVVVTVQGELAERSRTGSFPVYK